MSRLAGCAVLLTGASGGIGQALALRLAAAGAVVHAVGRDADALARLAVRAPAGSIQPLSADLATAAGLEAVRARVAAEGSVPVTCLVLGAAVTDFALLEDSEPAMLRRQIDTNLVAPMLLVQSVLPVLLRRPGAAIVAIGSTFGSLGYPGFAPYCASKFGLRGFVEALAREHADTSLRVQYVSPRATRTGLNSPRVDAMNAELGVAVDTPEAVAEAVLRAIDAGTPRRQIGWPERLFARLNGALPELVDRALAQQLPVVRRHARSTPSPAITETPA